MIRAQVLKQLPGAKEGKRKVSNRGVKIGATAR